MKMPVFLALLLAVAPAQAEPFRTPFQLDASGSVCQPTTPEDAKYVTYLDGAARADKPASVTCPLPPLTPGYRQVTARVTYWYEPGKWSKKQQCEFFNVFPNLHRRVPVLGIPGRERIGEAVFDPAEAGFVASVAICTLLPGQMLYAVTVDPLPL